MKTQILIVSVLLGLPALAQSFGSVSDSEKVIEVNLTQRNALIKDNLSCSVDDIDIFKNPPYLIYKKVENDGLCCKEIQEKINKGK